MPGRGCNPLFFLILLLLIAVLGWAAWSYLPGDIATPWGSGNPSGPPPTDAG